MVPSAIQEVEAPKISRQSAHEGGKVVSPRHRPSLAPGKIPEVTLILVRFSFVIKQLHNKIKQDPTATILNICLTNTPVWKPGNV
jgi:hypothetical protein